MKQLSIEEKAKAYDEALKQIKECIPDENGFITICPQEIFPELKESEDEMIRKALRERIIRYDPNNEILIKECGISQKQFLAWLEKQNKTKEKLNESEWSRDDEQYLLVCKNALAKYQITDKWDASIIYNWLKNKLQKNYDTRGKSQML